MKYNKAGEGITYYHASVILRFTAPGKPPEQVVESRSTQVKASLPAVFTVDSHRRQDGGSSQASVIAFPGFALICDFGIKSCQRTCS